MPDIGTVEFIIRVNPAILWGLFTLVVLVVLFVSIMLVYHWKEYSLNKKAFGRAITIYFTIAAILIGIAIVSILGYSFSLS